MNTNNEMSTEEFLKITVFPSPIISDFYDFLKSKHKDKVYTVILKFFGHLFGLVFMFCSVIVFWGFIWLVSVALLLDIVDWAFKTKLLDLVYYDYFFLTLFTTYLIGSVSIHLYYYKKNGYFSITK